MYMKKSHAMYVTSVLNIVAMPVPSLLHCSVYSNVFSVTIILPLTFSVATMLSLSCTQLHPSLAFSVLPPRINRPPIMKPIMSSLRNWCSRPVFSSSLKKKYAQKNSIPMVAMTTVRSPYSAMYSFTCGFCFISSLFFVSNDSRITYSVF